MHLWLRYTIKKTFQQFGNQFCKSQLGSADTNQITKFEVLKHIILALQKWVLINEYKDY